MAWQAQSLDEILLILFRDIEFVKIRDSDSTRNRALYLALSVDLKNNKNS